MHKSFSRLELSIFEDVAGKQRRNRRDRYTLKRG